MKNCFFLLIFSISLANANAQGREDFIADVSPLISGTKNLVLVIGSEQGYRAVETAEKSRVQAEGAVKYYGIQYLYLQNHTTFSQPVAKKLPIEIISQTKNKIVFRLPKVTTDLLEVDLGSVHESASQVGVQVSTISFQ